MKKRFIALTSLLTHIALFSAAGPAREFGDKQYRALAEIYKDRELFASCYIPYLREIGGTSDAIGAIEHILAMQQGGQIDKLHYLVERRPHFLLGFGDSDSLDRKQIVDRYNKLWDRLELHIAEGKGTTCPFLLMPALKAATKNLVRRIS